jgi:hypothetical protein
MAQSSHDASRPIAVIEARIAQSTTNRQQISMRRFQSLRLRNSVDHKIASGHRTVY